MILQRRPMTGQFIRSCHPLTFRSGQWAQIVGVDESTYGRPCFLLVFEDGATDAWPCVDEDARYEFAEEVDCGE